MLNLIRIGGQKIGIKIVKKMALLALNQALLMFNLQGEGRLHANDLPINLKIFGERIPFSFNS